MNKIYQLIAESKEPPLLLVENMGGTEATIYLHGIITDGAMPGGVNALDFIRELNNITAPVINIRINSAGGDVFGARSMVAAMRAHPSQIVAYVDGIAASAATFIVVSADKSFIADGGSIMVHCSMTLSAGNAVELEKTIALLKQVDQTIAEAYATKTGGTVEAMIALMQAETYLFGKDAVTAGFVDAVSQGKAATPTAKNYDGMYAKRRELLRSVAR